MLQLMQKSDYYECISANKLRNRDDICLLGTFAFFLELTYIPL